MASKTIDIVTAQNVAVTYDLAGLSNRMGSNALDIVIVSTGNYLRLMLDFENERSGLFPLQVLVFLWIYHLVCVLFFQGRTPGMRISGLYILKPGGGHAEFADLIIRWIVRPLDLTFTFCALGIFLMLGSEKRQRLGDMLAGTVVVKSRRKIHFSLRDILIFHEKTDIQQVRYPAVKHLKESEMLMIKNLVNNEGGYASSIHRELMHTCSKKMAGLLGVEEPGRNPEQFLQRLVNDYIVLTR